MLVEHVGKLPVPEADVEMLEHVGREVDLGDRHLVGVDMEDVDPVRRLGDEA